MSAILPEEQQPGKRALGFSLSRLPSLDLFNIKVIAGREPFLENI
jgi:hypothetical protein